MNISIILRILFTSFGLALWELYLKDLYKAYLIAQGKSLGVGEMMIGYFAILLGSYLLSYLITRRFSSE